MDAFISVLHGILFDTAKENWVSTSGMLSRIVAELKNPEEEEGLDLNID